MNAARALRLEPLAWSLVLLIGATGLLAVRPASAQPVSGEQRSTAQQVAQRGVPLADLSPRAPDSYTIKPGDTLWDISSMYLTSPWRWPELWGMNMNEVRNPHLIYPGQVLLLDKSGGVARLRVGKAVGASGGTVKLSPRVRDQGLADGAIAAVPMHVIAPFLNEAVILDGNELENAPRIVAAPENRVLVSRGDIAYVRGDVGAQETWRLFREPRPLRDPDTKEVLGYEADFVGTADFIRPGNETTRAGDGQIEIVPSTFRITSTRLEAGIGDRLSPVPARDYSAYGPHAPAPGTEGRIVSIYGGALHGGQNQIVALNRGADDGMERGHVLSLFRDGSRVVDRTDAGRPLLKLPNERHGMLYVFRVFKRMSYALVLSVEDPVRPGDRFGRP